LIVKYLDISKDQAHQLLFETSLSKKNEEPCGKTADILTQGVVFIIFARQPAEGCGERARYSFQQEFNIGDRKHLISVWHP